MHATANNPTITSTTAVRVPIDLATEAFELAFAGCFDNRPPLRIVMEAFGSAHY